MIIFKKNKILFIFGAIITVALVYFFYPKMMNPHGSPISRSCESCFGFEYEYKTSYLSDNGITRINNRWQKCIGIVYNCKSDDLRRYLE